MTDILPEPRRQELRDDWGQHFEMLTAKLYCEFVQPGSVVIDGGANAGMHTIPLAKMVGRDGKVIAVEPQKECISDLRGWLKKERLSTRVDIHQGVLSDKPGSEDFWINSSNNAMSARSIEDASLSVSEKIQVEAFTIDGLRANRQISFVKLDLEGGEYDALRGAVDTLMTDRPLVVFENGGSHTATVNGYKVSEFIQFLDQCGYRIVDFMGTEIAEAHLSIPSVFPWYFVAGGKASEDFDRATDLCVSYFKDISTHYRDWQSVITDISSLTGRKRK